MYRVGEVVELTRSEALGMLGAVPRGTRGVVLREPGLLSRGYVVRLDPAGRQVELPAEAIRRSGDVWSAPSAGSGLSAAPTSWPTRRATKAESAPPPEPADKTAPRRTAPPEVTPTRSTWRGGGDAARALP